MPYFVYEPLDWILLTLCPACRIELIQLLTDYRAVKLNDRSDRRAADEPMGNLEQAPHCRSKAMSSAQS